MRAIFVGAASSRDRVERCLSGRKSLIRNQVYGFPVPWVRIPPSPPEKIKGPHRGPFCFSGREWLRMRTPFDQRSRAAASELCQITIPTFR